MHLFKDRALVIATKHHKEKVIAPPLETALGVKCFTYSDFDTDIFGTFSGEVERNNDPLTTARLKCLKAMELANCDLGVASEGSFGPHPSLFFAAGDDEFLILIDKKNNLEIVARELSTETNFKGTEVFTEEDLLDFASQTKFPSHALILKPPKEKSEYMVKGIDSEKELLEVFDTMKNNHGSVYVETDMRAMNNPSRMRVIGKVTEKLVDIVKSHCPQCQTPGFTITEAIPGLPCDLCGMPTASTLSLINQCKHCGFREEKSNPRGKTKEDPMYCNYCNP